MDSSSFDKRDLVVVRDARKDYGGFHAVSGVSLTIRSGEVSTILGPNGAGKSSLLRCISGQRSLTGGAVYFPQGDAVDRMRPPMSFLPDDAVPHELMTGYEFVRYAGILRDMEPRDSVRQALELLDTLGIGLDMSELIGSYSSGMKQGLLLAVAFSGKPGLLVLDEPARSLDPGAVARLKVYLRDYVLADRGILLATHRIDIAASVSQTISIMKGGRIVETLRCEPGMNLDRIEEIYLKTIGCAGVSA